MLHTALPPDLQFSHHLEPHQFMSEILFGRGSKKTFLKFLPFSKGVCPFGPPRHAPPPPWEKDKLLVSDLQLLNRKEMPNLLEMAKVCSGSQFVKEASRFLANFLLSFQLYFAKFEPAIPSFTHFFGSLSSVQLAKWVWVKTNSHQNLV